MQQQKRIAKKRMNIDFKVDLLKICLNPNEKNCDPGRGGGITA
ncbi:MAG TPA: hypothetical protein VKQ52_02800 [Puia sp.]|nr:hypothetical protein [Puia sp.]